MQFINSYEPKLTNQILAVSLAALNISGFQFLPVMCRDLLHQVTGVWYWDTGREKRKIRKTSSKTW